MNFQTEPVLTPIKVLVVNPLSPTGQMIVNKIVNGYIFGEKQLIDLILLVYSNEQSVGERLKLDLIECAPPCYNTITVSSDLPSASDADVFCFLSNFYNLNMIEIKKMDTDEQFDALYLILKIASNLSGVEPEKTESIDVGIKFKKVKKPEIKPRKPIFMADGLVAMDILMSLSRNLPSDVFFCPTAIPNVAKSVLGDYLKVQTIVEINDVLTWAANDEVFHVEVEKPIITRDKLELNTQCDDDMAGKQMYRSFELDHTQFSPSWMKKEFIEKVVSTSSKNPYGYIFRASLVARALRRLWKARSDTDMKVNCNMGVISDGSLGTLKGYPYILPLILSGDSWSVNNRFEETPHLRNELKRINKAVKKQHEILIPYCKRFLQENVINQSFVPTQTESSSVFTSQTSSKSNA